MKEKEHTLALNFKLSPKLSSMLLTLYTLPIVPIEDIDAGIMHRLRKEVAQYDISIQTKRRMGYWISDGDKLHIKSVLETPKPLSWRALSTGAGIFHNKALREHVGFSDEQLVGFGWQKVKLVHDDDFPKHQEAWEEAKRSGVFEVMIRLLCADHEYHQFLLHGEPVLDDEGNIIFWNGLNTPLD